MMSKSEIDSQSASAHPRAPIWRSLVLVALLTLACATLPSRGFAALSCQAIFDSVRATETEVSTDVPAVTEVADASVDPSSQFWGMRAAETVRRAFRGRPALDVVAFDAAHERYSEMIAKGSNAQELNPQTSEEKLALWDVIGRQQGPDLFGLADWIRTAPNRDLKRAKRLAGILDASAPKSWSKARKQAVKLYVLTHPLPDTGTFLHALFSRPAQDVVEWVDYRIQVALVRKGVLGAMHELGFVKGQTSWERVRERLRPVTRPFAVLANLVHYAAAFTLPFVQYQPYSLALSSREPSDVVLRTYLLYGPGPETLAIYGANERRLIIAQRVSTVGPALVLGLTLILGGNPIEVAKETFESAKETYAAYFLSDADMVEGVTYSPEQRARIIEALVRQEARMVFRLRADPDWDQDQFNANFERFLLTERVQQIRNRLTPLNDAQLYVIANP